MSGSSNPDPTLEQEISKSIPCIQGGCDQKGTIAVQVGDDDWEPEQCQFCYEVRFPAIKKLLAIFESHLNRAVVEARKEGIVRTVKGINNEPHLFIGPSGANKHEPKLCPECIEPGSLANLQSKGEK